MPYTSTVEIRERQTLVMRDDFPINTKEILAKRVGYRCSSPECRQPTSGPQDDPAKAVNIGVAAHITAASPDGPRYDASLTTEQRKAHENGIWLCQNHGKLVDNDAVRYSAVLLREWKRITEQLALLELERPSRANNEDPELTWDEAVGVWHDPKSDLRYCAKCLSGGKRSPLKNGETGFSCQVCGHYTEDPKRRLRYLDPPSKPVSRWS